MKRTAATLCAALAMLAWSAAARAEILTYMVDLDGHQEVNAAGEPDKGDLDGSGMAHLFIDTDTNSIDWDFSVSGITLPLTLAHIHQAPAGTNGPVVVDFNAQLSGENVIDVDLANVVANPSGFYVNLHNADFPGGALRGQIGNPVPEPSTLLLAALGIAGIAFVKRH
jgi:hypothetical protein